MNVSARDVGMWLRQHGLGSPKSKLTQPPASTTPSTSRLSIYRQHVDSRLVNTQAHLLCDWHANLEIGVSARHLSYYPHNLATLPPPPP